MRALLSIIVGGVIIVGAGCCCRQAAKPDPVTAGPAADAELELQKFITAHVARLEPLGRENNLAQWQAASTGKKEAYQKNSQLEIAIRKLHADPVAYAYLEKTRAGGRIHDPLLRRQLEILWLAFRENQVDPELLTSMVTLSTKVQRKFNNFKPRLEGKEVSESKLYDILLSSDNSDQRRQAWLSYKKKGALVRDRILELVKLRNRVARELGYADFYQMRLRLAEQDPDQIGRLFETFAERTDPIFAKLMKGVKQKLSRRYRIGAEELMPWHYEDPFFQHAPAIGTADLDALFQEQDQVKLVRSTFARLGIDVGDIIERSDLYPRPNKMPYAFCAAIDRQGDIRILANLQPGERWTATLLHEMGHAVYEKYIDPKLPWLLRVASHATTTEAIAMMFGRLTRRLDWLSQETDIDSSQPATVADIDRQRRLELLVTARWILVVTEFERALYAQPDSDLNQLWWQLKERYQLMKAPPGRDAPDWASKIHITAYPAYYHNYLLGEMMASQVLGAAAAQKDADAPLWTQSFGQFLQEKIFRPGRSLPWDQLIKQATGKPLGSESLVKDLMP